VCVLTWALLLRHAFLPCKSFNVNPALQAPERSAFSAPRQRFLWLRRDVFNAFGSGFPFGTQLAERSRAPARTGLGMTQAQEKSRWH
jgi:hypothetical protein